MQPSPIRDETGLVLLGRKPDGRYIYETRRPFGGRHPIALTHSERVVLATIGKVASLVEPSARVFPYHARSCLGRGSYTDRRIWIPTAQLRGVDPVKRWMGTLAHEMAHTDGLKHGDSGFKPACAKWHAVLFMATSGFTRWPDVSLRDTAAPAQRAKRVKESRAARLKARTPEQRWTEELVAAQKKLVEWERRSRSAARKVAKWRRRVALCTRKRAAARPVAVELIAAKAGAS